MQAPKAEKAGTRRVRRRAQLSCTECRRRKQKCIPREEGACANCVRRYPPVECIFLPDPKLKKPDHDVVVPELSGFVRVVDGGRDAAASRSLFHREGQSSRSERISESYATSVVHGGGLAHSELELEVASTLSTGLRVRSDSRHARSHPGSIEGANSGPQNSTEGEVVRLNKFASPSPVAFAGALTQINGMHGAYVKSSLRNAELWNFFHYFVVPNMCSVDGSATSALFVREMLPWMIQSPLMPHIAILMSSASQAAEPALQTTRASETIVIKSQVLSLINDFLRQDFSIVGSEALRAVVHLVVIEWWWGTTSSLWAHMKGIKQMIKLRGGFQALNDPVLQQVFLVTDFEIACCFERDLFLIDPMMANGMPIPVPPTYAVVLRSPLLPYPDKFRHDKDELGLDAGTAEILDDVRFLTLSIIPASESGSTEKIRSTAAWLHKRVSCASSPISSAEVTPASTITSTIRLIALIYTLSISTLTPMSMVWTPLHMEDFYTHLFSLTMSQWKKIPGIFLWIMLVACPGTKEDARGKLLRRKMAVAGMQVGMEDFGVSISCLRAFWRVQRWIEKEGLKEKDAEKGDITRDTTLVVDR